MKEYILLTFIASVGLYGLFSIHHDVGRQDDHVGFSFDSQSLAIQQPAPQLVNKVQSEMIIDQECVWPQISLQISDFDRSSDYFLDYGYGTKNKITQATQILDFDHSGIYLVKLIKDNILIDVVELYVDLEQQSQVKLVSF
jgi:hypothetical protein